MFFEGFTLADVPVPGGTIRLRHGGSGPPLMLLHGNPQTHAMWHLVAPALAKRFTVICPDLRGYGFSLKPEATSDHAPYAKIEMAKDMTAVMDHFGFQQFLLAGHDRGARVSHRIALDNPDRILKLAILDIIPTIEHFERADADFALGYYHWFWLAQPHPFPEWLINRAPEDWWRQHTSRDPSLPELFHPEAMADYRAAVRQPERRDGDLEGVLLRGPDWGLDSSRALPGRGGAGGGADMVRSFLLSVPARASPHFFEEVIPDASSAALTRT
jgi:haloacetate dehalogenase